MTNQAKTTANKQPNNKANSKQPAPKRKRPPLKPVPCLAAIAAPIDGVLLAYQWQAIGYFPSRIAARRVIDAHMAENPTHTFVVLPQKMAGQSDLYDKLAATLPPQETKPKADESEAA